MGTWPPEWEPADLDELARDLREPEDALLTDLGAPGWRVSGDREGT